MDYIYDSSELSSPNLQAIIDDYNLYHYEHKSNSLKIISLCILFLILAMFCGFGIKICLKNHPNYSGKILKTKMNLKETLKKHLPCIKPDYNQVEKDDFSVLITDI